MTVDFAGEPAIQEGSPPDPETTVEVEEAVVEEDTSPPMTEAPAGEQEMPAPKPEMSDREKFFHLDFHKLDRNLSEEERREWNAIYASYRGGSPLSGTVIGVDMFSLNVRSRRTGEVRKRELSCAIVVLYRVRILIPETENVVRRRAARNVPESYHGRDAVLQHHQGGQGKRLCAGFP